ncbi:MAG TPA: ABC transporter permease [Vicinamibacterales bacterium]|jgi:putative ABC transport system permease protein|nr:ABC transporter permease [Vicinamibacterales bacterium]
MMVRSGLVGEVVSMAFDTVRSNKMRSGLTVLGVVIGITSIVGMTAMIRGFDESLRDSIRTIGPNLITIQRAGVLSFANGTEFAKIIKRPNLTVSDARAIEELVPTVSLVDIQLGIPGMAPPTQERVFYRDQRTRPLLTLGTTENFAAGSSLGLTHGRFFNGTEVQYRKSVVVLGQTPYQALFGQTGIDPIGKIVRVGVERYTVIGVFDKRPAVGGFNAGQDDFVVIPYTSYQRQFGLRGINIGRGSVRGQVVPIQLAALARDGVDTQQAIEDVRRVMRARHGLKLDDPDDFDIATQDAILGLWDRISQATFLALIVISSIALMVGGIGVMAIMSISVTERTREIGVRKALGARRGEILFQFLMEAAFLTSLGGILGIVLGSAIGWTVHLVSGFPISLPWWSFAIGLGFSASVGIFFGMWPAVKASRLDPIEALRYE